MALDFFTIESESLPDAAYALGPFAIESSASLAHLALPAYVLPDGVVNVAHAQPLRFFSIEAWGCGDASSAGFQGVQVIEEIP